MEPVEYVFKIDRVDIDTALEQVTQALEKRTELIAREKYPALWKWTDKLNGNPKAPESTLKKRKTYTKIISRTNVLLGTILLLMVVLFSSSGFLEPKSMFLFLLIGVLALSSGMVGLWKHRKKKYIPFTKRAKWLRNYLEQREDLRAQIVFLEHEMQLQASDADHRIISYSEFEYVIETADYFLVTCQGCFIVLQKRELVAENTADFCAFISSRAKLGRASVT